MYVVGRGPCWGHQHGAPVHGTASIPVLCTNMGAVKLICTWTNGLLRLVGSTLQGLAAG